jgi:signal transduction histidine kinase
MHSKAIDPSAWDESRSTIDASERPSTGATRPRRILVVDDDDDLRRALKEELQEQGYDAQEANNGKVALEVLRRWQPDAIVLDLNMPTLDGWEFRVQQRLNPRLAVIPVVVMSGDESPKARAIGAEAFIRKPFSVERLLAAIDRSVASEAFARDRLSRLAACERLATLGLLAAGLAHEINNPLAAVIGSLDLVQMEVARLTDVGSQVGGAPNSGASDFALLGSDVRDARSAAERIRVLARDICAFARYDDERTRSVAVSDVLESSLSLAWPQIRVRARLTKEYGSVPLVRGNTSQMEQVFLNLLVNAVQSIPAGHVDDNEIRLVTRVDGEGRVSIEVRDTGCGMTPETQQRIFEPFFTTKPVGLGTGIGLYLARHICRGMNGDIAVSSRYGEGSSFVVTLPATGSPSVDSETTVAPAALPTV